MNIERGCEAKELCQSMRAVQGRSFGLSNSAEVEAVLMSRERNYERIRRGEGLIVVDMWDE